MKAIHIVGWEEDRENADTRKYQQLLWYRNPVKLLGEGIGHTLAQPDRQGPFLYGMFKLIEQVAASGKKHERGWLVRNGTAMTPERIANLLRLPVPFVSEALDFFLTPPMDWLEKADFAGNPDATGRLPGESPGVPGRSAGNPDATGRNAPSDRPTEPTKVQRTKEGTHTQTNGGFESKAAARAAQSAQYGAAKSRIEALERIAEDERGPEDEAELKKMRGVVRAIQKKQTRNDFTPVGEGEK